MTGPSSCIPWDQELTSDRPSEVKGSRLRGQEVALASGVVAGFNKGVCVVGEGVFHRVFTLCPHRCDLG